MSVLVINIKLFGTVFRLFNEIIILACIIIALGILILLLFKYIHGTLSTNFQIMVLRYGYWVGAIIDLLAFFMMLASMIEGFDLGYSVSGVTNDYRFAMTWASSLMLGWTVLLIWGDRKPVDRKEIVLFTVFPVIIGVLITNILYKTEWIQNAIGAILFMCCYMQSINLPKEEL